MVNINSKERMEQDLLVAEDIIDREFIKRLRKSLLGKFNKWGGRK